MTEGLLANGFAPGMARVAVFGGVISTGYTDGRSTVRDVALPSQHVTGAASAGIKPDRISESGSAGHKT